MAKTREEMDALMHETWEAEDSGVKTAKALELTGEVQGLFNQIESLTSEREELQKRIDDLRKVNSELFSRVTKPEEPKAPETSTPEAMLEAVLKLYD